jgi:hypothetical protein
MLTSLIGYEFCSTCVYGERYTKGRFWVSLSYILLSPLVIGVGNLSLHTDKSAVAFKRPLDLFASSLLPTSTIYKFYSPHKHVDWVPRRRLDWINHCLYTLFGVRVSPGHQTRFRQFWRLDISYNLLSGKNSQWRLSTRNYFLPR